MRTQLELRAIGSHQQQLKRFLNEDYVSAYFATVLNGEEIAQIKSAGDVVCKEGGEFEESTPWSILKWLPAYGAVLIATRLPLGDYVHIYVLGADEWRFTSFDGEHGARCSKDAPMLSVGSIASSKLPDFMINFESIMSAAKAKTGKGRHADNAGGGHQMTPAFVYAVSTAVKEMRILENDECEFNVQPRGGFTDVGRHTGSDPRHTDFSLIMSVIYEFLKSNLISPLRDPSLCFEVLLMGYILWNLDNYLEGISPTEGIISRENIDEAMQLLNMAGQLAIGLSTAGISNLKFANVIEDYRKEIDDLVSVRIDKLAAQYELHVPTEAVPSLWPSPQLDKFNTSMECATEGLQGIDILQSRAVKNLNGVDFPKVSHGFGEILTWFRNNASAPFLLQAEIAESVIFGLFEHGKALSKTYSEPELRSLLDIVAQHQQMEGKIFNSKDIAKGMNRSSYRSRTVLMFWICYCVVHKSASSTYPLLKKHQPTLNFKDMQHFLFEKKLEMDALRSVCGYLVDVTAGATKPPVFSGRPTEANGTLDFADAYAITYPSINELWVKEKAEAAARQQAQWLLILEKQEQCAQLKRKKADLQRELANLSSSSHYYYNYNSFQRDCSELRYKIDSIDAQLSAAKKPPSRLYQPLPEDETEAKRCLVLCHLPSILCLLADAGVMAYKAFPSEHKCNITLEMIEYYDKRSVRRSTTKSTIIFDVPSIPRLVDESSVENICSARQHVWHPPNCTPQIKFDFCNGGHYDNPFIFEPAEITEKLTEPLSCTSLNWAVVLPPHEILPTRGNLALTKFSSKPFWLNKQSFLVLTSLRSFPFIQFRKLLVALKDQSLPFGKADVHVIVKQLMYQTGRLSLDLNNTVSVEWRKDMFNQDGFRAFYEELECWADQLKSSPQNGNFLYLMIEICAYFLQWSDEFQPLIRRYALIALAWADELDAGIRHASEWADPNVKNELCVKQTAFLNYALIGLISGSPQMDDIEMIVELCVRSCKNSTVFVEQYEMDAEPLANPLVRRMYLAYRQKYAFVSLILKSPSCLTKAAACVLPMTFLSSLEWRQAISDTCCFEAINPEGNLISVNVLNGTVLFNGRTPSQLPREVTDHTLYRKHFGLVPLETVTNSDGSMSTVQSFDDSFYMFSISGSDLTVFEINNDVRFKLLDSNDQWSKCLPMRLRKLYSHWYSDQGGGCVIMRPIKYRETDIHYVVADVNSMCRICEVPKEWRKHERSKLFELVGEMKRLVVVPEAFQVGVIKVLSKMEETRFIHTLVNLDKNLEVSFPRFSMGFEMKRGTLISLEHVEYKLDQHQQFNDTLYGYSSYLVLSASDPEKPEMIGQPTMKLLIPEAVTFDKHGIQLKSSAGADHRVIAYQIDELFGTIKATGVAARLQLAALYTITGTLLPEKRTSCTGAEQAIDLVRKSWINRPLKRQELDNLKAIVNSSHIYHAPSLIILCERLFLCSQSLPSLFHSVLTERMEEHQKKFRDASTAYERQHNVTPVSWRSELTEDEQMISFGRVVKRKHTGFVSVAASRPPTHLSFTTGPFASGEPANSSVSDIENQLYRLLSSKSPDLKAVFPLDVCEGLVESKLAKTCLDDLKQSWEAFVSLEVTSLNKPIEDVAAECKTVLEIVGAQRSKLYATIVKNIMTTPNDSWYADAHSILKLLGNLPTVTTHDIVRMAVEPSILKQFNEFMSDDDVLSIRKQIIRWLELVVLEGRCHRITKLIRANKKPEVMRELETVRSWSVEANPEWLVFEAAQGIQIRPEQMAIIRHCIDNDNSAPIVQLNMGLGKTRVIVPCLILQWTKAKGSNLPLLYMLTELLDEGFDNLHSVLCDSVFYKKLFRVPFHRDVELNAQSVHDFVDTFTLCMRVGGCLVMAPEHRQSFELKKEELRQSENKQLLSTLNKISQLPSVEIYDESDELLSHRRQLVYAVGEQENLRSGTCRWRMIQSILHICRQKDSVRKLLEKKNVSTSTQTALSHEFNKLALLSGNAVDETFPKVKEAIVNVLFDDPPRHQDWMKQAHITATRRQDIFNGILNQSVALDPTHFLEYLNPDELDQVLMLRGLLSFDIMKHCLTKRWRVDYGVYDRLKKRIAIPFKAADTPSVRSEFVHPDCALFFTVLSYYSHGLKREQLKEAFTYLLSLGDTAQAFHYNEWFRNIDPSCHEGRNLVDDVRKIDLSSDSQFDLLARLFQRHRWTIDFWLDNCVFPAEMAIFPQRLISTSWDLTSLSEKKCGFSGTNDTSALLPLHVKQQQVGFQSLNATNGRMLNNLKLKSVVTVLPRDDASNLPRTVIETAMAKQVDALIDAGALMVGLSQDEMIDLLLRHLLKDRYRGIVLFDAESKEWIFIDPNRRRWSLHNSPIRESQAFVYFDQSRCRGADMKLKSGAVGMLTISLGLQKDRLMQGAGRLRGLDFSQSIVFAVPAQVAHTISEKVAGTSTDLTADNILQFTLTNSIQHVASGIQQWSTQAYHHASSSNKPELMYQDEEVELIGLYSHARTPQKVAEADVAIRNGLIKKLDDVPELFHKVTDYVADLGSDIEVFASTFDQECEREIEKQNEAEEENEKEVPKETPREEISWKVETIWDVEDVQGLDVPVVSLRKFINERIHYDYKTSWRNMNETVFLTDNFWNTIKKASQSMNDFLKLVDTLVVFENSVLVLSDKEADLVVQKRNKRPRPKKPLICNFAYLKQYLKEGSNLRVGSVSECQRRLNDIVAMLQLFAGDTIYDNALVSKNIRDMLADLDDPDVAFSFAKMRGQGHYLSCSDLERIATETKFNQRIKRQKFEEG